MRGRCNCQQVRDHRLVEARESVIDKPGPLWRPVPQQRVVFRSFAVPIPLDRFPEICDPLIDTLLGFAIAFEVLARRQQDPPSEKMSQPDRRRYRTCRRPTWSALCCRSESETKRRGSEELFSRKSKICERRSMPCSRVMKPRSTPTMSAMMPNPVAPVGNNALVSRNIFERRSGDRMCSLPVVTEAGLLQHGEQFIIRQFLGRGGGWPPKERTVGTIDRPP